MVEDLNKLKEIIKIMEKLNEIGVDFEIEEKKEKQNDLEITQSIMDTELKMHDYDAIEALKSMFNTIEMSWKMTKSMFGEQMKDKKALTSAFIGTLCVKVLECTSVVYNHKKAKNTETALNYAMSYIKEQIKKELN